MGTVASSYYVCHAGMSTAPSGDKSQSLADPRRHLSPHLAHVARVPVNAWRAHSTRDDKTPPNQRLIPPRIKKQEKKEIVSGSTKTISQSPYVTRSTPLTYHGRWTCVHVVRIATGCKLINNSGRYSG